MEGPPFLSQEVFKRYRGSATRYSRGGSTAKERNQEVRLIGRGVVFGWADWGECSEVK